MFAACVLGGGLAAWHYASLGLTLSHYDARGHLVVSRRIADSLTPGWRQIGAVWLPLPHLINALPTQIDWAYRTGAIAVAISVLSMAAGCTALALFAIRHLGSIAAACVAPALIMLNPNVLYLQSTPMTEPMLFGASLLALAAVAAWLATPQASNAVPAGLALAALALIRYEGWAIAGALVGLATATKLERREPAAFALVPYVVLAILSFLLLSWGSTGVWFVSSGFFVPDPRSLHEPWVVLDDIWNSTLALTGWPVLTAAAVGLVIAVGRLWGAGARSLPLALVAAAALPALAFYQGHPHRVRYMVPLVVASAALAALAIAALPRRVQILAAAIVCASTIYARPPFDPHAPMVTEAQWEIPFRTERHLVTLYLNEHYNHAPILASMGSLGHYMHESSSIGLGITNFVHEGNGDLWSKAVRSPRRHVEWLLIEERAEGGDVLATSAQRDAGFLDGFARVAEGGGMALYRRQ